MAEIVKRSSNDHAHTYIEKSRQLDTVVHLTSQFPGSQDRGLWKLRCLGTAWSANPEKTEGEKKRRR